MKCLSCFFVLLLLSGCFKPVATPAVSQYTLNATPQAVAMHEKSNQAIFVTRPVAYPGYDTQQLIYVEKPHQLQRYVNSQWVAAPADLMLPLLVHALRNTYYYQAVVAPPIAGQYDFRLDTQIVKLQQEFNQYPSRIRMVITANVIDSKTNKVLASKTFEAIITSPYENPYGGVIAANQAAGILTAAIAEFAVTHSG